MIVSTNRSVVRVQIETRSGGFSSSREFIQVGNMADSLHDQSLFVGRSLSICTREW